MACSYKVYGNVAYIAARHVVMCAAVREAVIWPCSCEVHSDEMCVAVREAVIRPMWLRGMWQHSMCSCNGGGNMVYVAARGATMWLCRYEEGGNVVYVAVRGTAMWHMQLQGEQQWGRGACG